jgi:hypothetical protein
MEFNRFFRELLLGEKGLHSYVGGVDLRREEQLKNVWSWSG